MSVPATLRTSLWVVSAAAVALGCSLVSHTVASTRAELEAVESRLASTRRDIRALGTEIGTRGRLAQLERWNARVLALSAPAEQQFVADSFQLATMVAPDRRNPIGAPVVLASAPARSEGVTVAPSSAAAAPLAGMIHTASYSGTAKPTPPAPPARVGGVGSDRPAAPVKPVAAEVPKPAVRASNGAAKSAVAPSPSASDKAGAKAKVAATKPGAVVPPTGASQPSKAKPVGVAASAKAPAKPLAARPATGGGSSPVKAKAIKGTGKV